MDYEERSWYAFHEATIAKFSDGISSFVFEVILGFFEAQRKA